MLSIIVPCYNQHEATEECLLAVRENTQDFELVIIDNGSEPAIKPPFTGFIDVTLIRNDENKGFPVAVNQGIRAAKGDIIILLNNDVVVTPSWAERMIRLLDEYAIVGCCTNYAAGIQRVVSETYTSKESLYDAAESWAENYSGVVDEVNFIIGFCMVFKKSLAEEMGWWDSEDCPASNDSRIAIDTPVVMKGYKYFDDSLWPCSGEEIDFCFRARAAGHKIGVAGDVYVHHEGSQTLNDMDRSGQVNYGELCDRNDKHLAEKWGDDFWQRQAVISEGLRLNLGCGMIRISGFVNIDQLTSVEPDIVADVLNLPYEPESIDEIYCGHLLEHMRWEEGLCALRYWWKLLKYGSEIRVAVPDFDILATRYLKNPTVDALKYLNDYYIFSYVQESQHKYVYSAALLEEALKLAGFSNLERMPIDHEYYPEKVDWQIGMKGVKR